MNNTNLDLCQVFLNKKAEDESFVWYEFEFQYRTNKFDCDSKGKKRFIIEPRRGVLKIPKNFFDETDQKKSVNLEEKLTDPVFFALSDKEFQYLLYTCLSAIKNCKTGVDFPNKASRQI